MLSSTILLSASLWAGLAFAETFTIDPADPRVTKFPEFDPWGNKSSWIRQKPSVDNCNTPQMLTSTIGDYLQFPFEGNSVEVFGTFGPKRGLITFDVDGTQTVVDRSSYLLSCESSLFKADDLRGGQHTLKVTLTGYQPNYNVGQAETGTLSVQRIQYTSSEASSSNNTVIIAVSASAGAVLLLVGLGLFWFWRRKNRKAELKTLRHSFMSSEPSPTWNDEEDRGSAPAMVVTPFTRNGSTQSPQPQQPHDRHQHQRRSSADAYRMSEQSDAGGRRISNVSDSKQALLPSGARSPDYAQHRRTPSEMAGGYEETQPLTSAHSSPPSTPFYPDFKGDRTSRVVNPDGSLSSHVDRRASRSHIYRRDSRSHSHSRSPAPENDAFVDSVAHRVVDIMSGRHTPDRDRDAMVSPPAYSPSMGRS